MRVLVTGADGFVARHLIPLLEKHGAEVIGTALTPALAPGLGIPLESLDVTDTETCRAVVQRVRPNQIVHLAAASSVQWSFEHPEETHRINVEGTQHLLEAAAEQEVRQVLLIGSSEEYGIPSETPVAELPVADLRPLSPYAQSKVDAERLIEATPAFRSRAIRTRSFPHIGPGQRAGFFSADIASRLVRIAAGREPPLLRVGNIDTVRDYTDVRDTVRAYALLLERGTPGEVYNVASGRAVSLRSVMDQLIALAGVQVRVQQDSAKVRLTDIPVNLGDATKLRVVTGWTPEIPLSQTLTDILAWWRTQGA